MFEDFELDEIEFEEWDDDTTAITTEALVNWSAGLLSILLLAYNLNNPSIALPATFLVFFSLTRGSLGLLEVVYENHPLLSVASFGNARRMIYGIIGGVLFSFLAVMFFPIATASIPSIGIGSTVPVMGIDSDYLMVGWLSPIIEEFIFRGLLVFTFALLLDNLGVPFSMGISSIGVSGIFVLFHMVIYGALPSVLLFLFMISLAWIIGNFVFRSLSFSMASHLTLNLIVLGVG